MFYFINITLGLILLIAMVVIVVKKVFIGLKSTDSGIINILLIIICLIGLFCSFSAFLGVFRIHGSTIVLNTEKNISSEQIASIKSVISETKTSNISSLVVGYISLVLDYIAYKVIEKKKKQELERDKKHWNLNKLN